MSTSPDPREQYGTHMLPGRSYEEEFVRLRLQNQFFTSGMRGVWPEQPPGAEYHRVLDVGCCSGCWLVQAARTYPAIQQLFGVDMDSYMIAQARAFASEQGVADRVEFHVMDALRMLEFPFNYLDLVSMQLGGGNFLRTWEWPKLLQEVLRVMRPGGTFRVVESDVTRESTSPALNHLTRMIAQTMYRAGHYFSPEYTGLIDSLPRLFEQFGVQDIRTSIYTLEFHAGTVECRDFVEYVRLSLRTVVPLIGKWGRIADDYKELCDQAQREMEQPDFAAKLMLFVIWGSKLP